VLTTDVGVNGNRERDLRNNFGLPMRYMPGLIYDGVTHPRWSLGFMLNGMPQLGNFATADCSDVEMQADPYGLRNSTPPCRQPARKNPTLPATCASISASSVLRFTSNSA
jgi:hypothetical protein